MESKVCSVSQNVCDSHWPREQILYNVISQSIPRSTRKSAQRLSLFGFSQRISFTPPPIFGYFVLVSHLLRRLLQMCFCYSYLQGCSASALRFLTTVQLFLEFSLPIFFRFNPLLAKVPDFTWYEKIMSLCWIFSTITIVLFGAFDGSGVRNFQSSNRRILELALSPFELQP